MLQNLRGKLPPQTAVLRLIFITCTGLFGGALESEEALDVEVCALLEARPVGVLGVDGVEAELGDDHALAEGLVPRVDPQRPGPPAKQISGSHATSVRGATHLEVQWILNRATSPKIFKQLGSYNSPFSNDQGMVQGDSGGLRLGWVDLDVGSSPGWWPLL